MQIHCTGEEAEQWDSLIPETGGHYKGVHRLGNGLLASPDPNKYTCGICLEQYWNKWAWQNYYPFDGYLLRNLAISGPKGNWQTVMSAHQGNDYY